jgi:hypothetical protein
MNCNAASFSTAKVEKFLRKDGYTPGSKEFMAERSRRYYKDGESWFERDDWDGERHKFQPPTASGESWDVAGSYVPAH